MSEPSHLPRREAKPLAKSVKRGFGHALGHLHNMARRSSPVALRGPACGVALMALSACGSKPADLVLNRVPANTNLHKASSLPAESVRTVARREFGWRLIYHPTHAPYDAEQRAASALCRLEDRRAARIQHVPRIDPTADAGARIIDIYCA